MISLWINWLIASQLSLNCGYSLINKLSIKIKMIKSNWSDYFILENTLKTCPEPVLVPGRTITPVKTIFDQIDLKGEKNNNPTLHDYKHLQQFRETETRQFYEGTTVGKRL